MTEKTTPTHDLGAIKRCFATESDLKVTGSALRGASELGFGRAEIVQVIRSIERLHFWKSMP